MAVDAAAFFEIYFRELNRRGIPFVILHSYGGLPERMTSDIDYAVRRTDLPKLLAVQRELAAKHGWMIASVMRAKLSALYTVLFRADDVSRFIQLDACADYVEGGCSLMSDVELMEGRRPFLFFFAPAPAVEFAYVLAKALVKRKPIAAYLPRLRLLWEADPDGSRRWFKKLMGDAVEPLDTWFSRSPGEWDRRLLPRLRARKRFGLSEWIHELGRAARRIARPAGLHIAILGSDGAGKSTLIAQLNPENLPCVRRRRLFHFRPHLLEANSGRAPVSDPHGSPPRSRVASVAKLLYYFFDQWAGYLVAVWPAKIRNELVIFDRSFEDILIDPRRYRLSCTEGLARLLKYLIPRADLTFVLDVEPALVHARKPELPLVEIERQRAAFQQLAKTDRRHILVRADEPAEEVARNVIREMIAWLAAREQRRN